MAWCKHHIFFRKRGTSPDSRRRKIFDDIVKHTELFESEKKDFFIRRAEWLTKNPEYSHPDLVPLNIRAYSSENILVISPHPDDEIIGCGGTLIQLLAEGSTISVVQLTDGSNTAALKDAPDHIRTTVRLKEAQVVASRLGFANLFLCKERDSHLKCTKETVNKISGILHQLRPGVIFVPFINDIHPDHRAANEILGTSLALSSLNLPEVRIVSYEVWNLVPPNSYCIIDDQFDEKTEMLREYRTAMKVIDYIQFCENLNSYHAVKLLGIKGFAEVFLDIDAERYIQLVRGIEVSG